MPSVHARQLLCYFYYARLVPYIVFQGAYPKQHLQEQVLKREVGMIDYAKEEVEYPIPTIVPSCSKPRQRAGFVPLIIHNLPSLLPSLIFFRNDFYISSVCLLTQLHNMQQLYNYSLSESAV